jgi:hypothetical protein
VYAVSPAPSQAAGDVYRPCPPESTLVGPFPFTTAASSRLWRLHTFARTNWRARIRARKFAHADLCAAFARANFVRAQNRQNTINTTHVRKVGVVCFLTARHVT